MRKSPQAVWGTRQMGDLPYEARGVKEWPSVKWSVRMCVVSNLQSVNTSAVASA